MCGARLPCSSAGCSGTRQNKSVNTKERGALQSGACLPCVVASLETGTQHRHTAQAHSTDKQDRQTAAQAHSASKQPRHTVQAHSAGTQCRHTVQAHSAGTQHRQAEQASTKRPDDRRGAPQRVAEVEGWRLGKGGAAHRSVLPRLLYSTGKLHRQAQRDGKGAAAHRSVLPRLL